MNFMIGFLSCIVLMGIFMFWAMPYMGKLFFVQKKASVGFERTLEIIRENVASNENGWFVAVEKDFNKAYEKEGHPELPFKLTEFKLGNPRHSYVTNLAFPAIATFMPAAIAVVEYKSGEVWVYLKNTGLLGRFFQGTVREVMSKQVPVQMQKILNGAL